MTDHECPAPGCTRRVPRSQLACRAHWYALPQQLRDDVWRTYRSYGAGSMSHRIAVIAAMDYLIDRYGPDSEHAPAPAADA